MPTRRRTVAYQRGAITGLAPQPDPAGLRLVLPRGAGDPTLELQECPAWFGAVPAQRSFQSSSIRLQRTHVDSFGGQAQILSAPPDRPGDQDSNRTVRQFGP